MKMRRLPRSSVMSPRMSVTSQNQEKVVGRVAQCLPLLCLLLSISTSSDTVGTFEHQYTVGRPSLQVTELIRHHSGFEVDTGGT